MSADGVFDFGERGPDPAGERETEAALCQGRGPGLEREADPYQRGGRRPGGGGVPARWRP